MSKSIKKIASKYKSLGIIKGNELLLAPIVALSLLDDLAELDIKVILCESWRYIKTQDGIIEIVGGGMGFGNYKTLTSKTIAEALKDYVSKKIPKDADLVSLLIEDPAIDSLFTN